MRIETGFRPGPEVGQLQGRLLTRLEDIKAALDAKGGKADPATVGLAEAAGLLGALVMASVRDLHQQITEPLVGLPAEEVQRLAHELEEVVIRLRVGLPGEVEELAARVEAVAEELGELELPPPSIPELEGL